MSFIDDLTKATKLFEEQWTALGQQRAVNAASKRTEELRKKLKNQEINENQFRQEQNQLGTDLAQQLQGMGASVNQQQSAISNFGPTKALTANERLAEEFASGATEPSKLVKSQMEAQDYSKIQAAARVKSQNEEEAERKRLFVIEMAKIKKTGEKSRGTKKQFNNIATFTSKFSAINQNAVKLKKIIEEHGTSEFFGSAEGEMEQLIQAMATDAAKLFDPDSAAREGEVALFRKFFFEPGTLKMRNSTAIDLVGKFQDMLAARAENEIEINGIASDKMVGLIRSQIKTARENPELNTIKGELLSKFEDTKTQVSLSNAIDGLRNPKTRARALRLLSKELTPAQIRQLQGTLK